MATRRVRPLPAYLLFPAQQQQLASREGSAMTYWVHIARSIDRAVLHRERCSEIPASYTKTDFWEGGWYDYPDKERALAALEQSGATDQRKCPLCKP